MITFVNIKKKINWTGTLKWVATITIFSILLIDGNKLFREITIGKAIQAIRIIPNTSIFIYAILGIVMVSTITLYDFIWFRFNPSEIKSIDIFKTSFISATINNLIGLGGLGGALIRQVFYKSEKINSEEIIKINLMLIPSYLTGLGVLMWINIFRFRDVHDILISYPVIYLVITIFAIYLIIFLFGDKFPLKFVKEVLNKWNFSGKYKIKIALVTVSTLDWLGASFLLWYIANDFKYGISFWEIVFFFTVSMAIGIISPIPSGVGIFDVIMVIGLNKLGLSGTQSTTIVLLFRIFYYFIPFIISIILLIFKIIASNYKNSMKLDDISYLEFLRTKVKFSDYQIEIVRDIFAIILWFLMLISSIILIFSAIMPTIPDRIRILYKLFSFTTMQFSQKTTLILGLLLFILSFEIKQKVKKAFDFSVIFLVLGIFFTLIKGLNVEESFFLMITLVIFVSIRKYFYRVAVPFDMTILIKQVFFSQLFIILYVMSGQKINFSFYKLHKGIELLNVNPENYIKNGVLLTILTQSFIIIWYLYAWFISRKNAPWISQDQSYVYGKLESIISKYNGNPLTHLIYCGDKYVYTSEQLGILVSFKPYYKYFVVLGEPIGNLDKLTDFLEEFRNFADLYGYTPVYYQIEEKYLAYYHDAGHTFFKLGQDAIINLNEFSIYSKALRGFRSTKNRLERENYIFEVIMPPFTVEFFNQIENISKEWLNGKKEKGFSLGIFDREYLERAPISIIKNSKNQIVAFATLIPTYSPNSISVDLMRFSKEAPSGTMDYLFLMLFDWAKANGYTNFYMGMAPLSDVGQSKFARREEKIAKLIFASRKINYNFKGLRNYKEKFHPHWENKYLAYPILLRPEPILLNISVMIGLSHKKLKK